MRLSAWWHPSVDLWCLHSMKWLMSHDSETQIHPSGEIGGYQSSTDVWMLYIWDTNS